MYKKITAVAMVAAFAAMTASAGIIVQTGPSVSGGQANLSADAGQTFTATGLGTDTTLGTIAIEGPLSTVVTDPMGPFTLELWTDADGDHSTWGTGTLVATSDSQSMASGNAVTTFTFNSGILTEGAVYAFTYTDGTGTRVAARMGLDNVNDISTGTLFGGGVQQFGNAYDTTMTVTTIPEPATLGLVAVFGGAVLFIRRKMMI